MNDKLSIIKEAITEGKSINVSYSNSNGETSQRILSNISFTNKFDEYGYQNEHITAFCHNRQEERSFKIARISTIRIVEQPLKQKIEIQKPRLESSKQKIQSQKPSLESPKPKQTNEGCYIATMVYGNYDHHQVIILRNFRDNVLLNSYLGTCFVKFYYKKSPQIVAKLSGYHMVNKVIRKILDFLIKMIK